MRVTRLVTSILLALAMTVALAGTVAAEATYQFFRVTLEPQAPNTEGSGTALLRVNAATDEVCYVIRVEGIGVPTEPAGGLGAAHIHDVATGGIFVDLETQWRATGPDRFMSLGCAVGAGANIDAILAAPEAYYVNIHTTAFPGGAIRGSLG